MVITAKFDGSSVATAHGLTQWDYGQVLEVEAAIDIPDATEVHFYQGELDAMCFLRDGSAKIPDRMLQDSSAITAYIYVRSGSSGETVLTAYLPITARPRPTDYVLPDTEEYRRLLPPGGAVGQVPVRQGGADYAVGWGYRADGVVYENEYLQLMSGNVPVGERVRVVSESGREIELANDGTSIKWRYTDSNEWQVLASLESLKGPPGDVPDFAVRNGHLIAIYK